MLFVWSASNNSLSPKSDVGAKELSETLNTNSTLTRRDVDGNGGITEPMRNEIKKIMQRNKDILPAQRRENDYRRAQRQLEEMSKMAKIYWEWRNKFGHWLT